MTNTGLGQDGYIQFQKETAYDTATVDSLTSLPLTEGTLLSVQQQIEKLNIINSRIKQTPQDGRVTVGPADLTFPMVPDLIGNFMNLVFGLEDAVAGDGETTAYTHTFLMPITGSTDGISWTMRQAIGGDLADQYNGVKMTKFILKSDSEGYMQIVATLVGVGHDDNDVDRDAAITISSKKFMTFCDGKVEITPSGVAKFEQKVNSFEIEFNWGYDEDGARFKVGSCTADAPIFGTIPSVMFRCEIDAERRFEDWAKEIKQFKIDVTLTSEEIALGAIPYSFDVEIPVAILSPETNRENAVDNNVMSLEMTALGGTSTGSGATSVPAEVRVADMTPTYTGY